MSATSTKGALLLMALVALLLAVAPAHGGLLERLFAPRAELWERWTAHDDGNDASIDHGAWERFLERYVVPGDDGIARVHYAAVDDADRAALAAYLQHLGSRPISSHARGEQRAYWINLYNALTVATVLDRYPVASIRDIDLSPGLFADGPWGARLIEVEGEALSLNDIEHRILRPIWRDPRIHYAVNCASLGCPDLQPVAFTAGNTEALLDAAARGYVNHPRGVTVSGTRLTLSSIYSWFGDDFSVDGGVLAHLRKHAEPDLAERLAAFDSAHGYAYDWRLNDAAGR